MSKTGAPRKVLDLNALRAQQADALGEKHVEFELTPEGADKPESFRILRRNWWPVKLLVKIEQLDGSSADLTILRDLMGDDQFERALDAGLTVGDLTVLFNQAIGSQEDPGLGESAGSSES